MLFLGQIHFGKLYMDICFLKKNCVVTLLYIIIYEKYIISGIAFGEMYELLTWKNEHLLFNF